MWTSQLVNVGDVALNLTSAANNGPSLLLLHGVLRSGRDFASLWPALMTRRQVHVVDHRGHGGSGRVPQRYHVCDYAQDAIRLVQQHLTGPVVIYGHSLGALVAAATAAACPNRVEAVILEDPPSAVFLRQVDRSAWHAVWTGMHALAGSSAPVAEVTRQLADVRQPLPDGGSVRLGDLRDLASLRFSAACLKQVDPDVFPPLLDSRWLDGFDVDAVFAGIGCPTLLLRADPALGGMLSRTEAEGWIARMKEGLLVDVPGVGHLIHTQATETTLRILLPFLESLQGS